MTANWVLIKNIVLDLEKLGTSIISETEVVKIFTKNHGSEKNPINVGMELKMLSVNSQSRLSYIALNGKVRSDGVMKTTKSEYPRVSNPSNKKDVLYYLGDGSYQLYDPSKHGTWEIRLGADNINRLLQIEAPRNNSSHTIPPIGKDINPPLTATSPAVKRQNSSPEQLGEDIESIICSTNIEETEKLSLIKSRIGQGEFRQKLISYWKQCSVTGFNDIDLLVASHIKPWRAANNAERLNHFNGLLLVPNLDKAFDTGYITFDARGHIQISPHLKNPETLGIHPEMRIKNTPDHEVFMAFHRSEIFMEK